MSTDNQNIGYYYQAGLHLGPTHHNPLQYYGGTTQMLGGTQYGRYNQCQELSESGLIYSQNYCIQPPPYSKTSLNQLNMGSTHGLCQNDDNDNHLGRSRGDSINFMPIASANLDDNNFYPQNGQDQIVSSNFNDLNAFNGTQSQQIHQPMYHSQQNYLMDDMVGSSTVLNGNSTNDMLYPSYNYNYSSYPMMQNDPHQHNINYSQYQMPMVSQQYLMNDISNLPPQTIAPPNGYMYQNASTSLHNLCYEGENAQMGVQDEKLSTFQQVPDFQGSLETPQPKNKKKVKRVESQKGKVQNENDPSEKVASHLKQTEKVKRKYVDDLPKKYETKEEAFSQDENTPVLPSLLVKRAASLTPRNKKSSKTLSEATTNFDLNSDIHTPTLKERSYKKVKIEEKESHLKSSTSSADVKTACSENTLPSPPKTGLLSLPQEKLVEALKNIMKSLPPAYLPFLHKKQTDSQKLDYLKKHHHVTYQSDLNKIKGLLPVNFTESFNVSIESVYQNTYIMNGIFQNMPDESQKKIGTLTRKERREKINKYKVKRDKRASCRKISYDVRKRVADSRLRVKGRFVTKEQALQMIGDTSGDLDKYTNQELRELLYQKFGGENGDRTKKFPLDDDDNQILNLLNNDDNNLIDEEDYDYEEDEEDCDEKK